MSVSTPPCVVTFAGTDPSGGAGIQADIKAISTGSLLIDEAIGIGGLPCGRIVEVFGPESSGKTTLALQTIAQAQKAVEYVLLLMLNMHWIQNMQGN